MIEQAYVFWEADVLVTTGYKLGMCNSRAPYTRNAETNI